MLEKQLQRRILESATAAPGHNDVPYPVAQLQQRLEQNVVLMIVSDERIVDHIGKVLVGIARDVTLVGVAEDRIEENAHPSRLNQNAGVTEVAPTRSIAFVFRIWFRLLGSEKRPEQLFVFAAEFERFGNLARRRRDGIGAGRLRLRPLRPDDGMVDRVALDLLGDARGRYRQLLGDARFLSFLARGNLGLLDAAGAFDLTPLVTFFAGEAYLQRVD